MSGIKEGKERMKTGTRVEVDARNAAAWGYLTPALGVVIGGDPDGSSDKVFAVKLDQGRSVYEVKGCHVSRLKARRS